MGLYIIDCPACNKSHQWFSGNADQRCSECIVLSREKAIESECALHGTSMYGYSETAKGWLCIECVKDDLFVGTVRDEVMAFFTGRRR